MNDSTRMVDPIAIGRNFTEQLAFISSNPPKAGSLMYLLPPCLVLIAIDVAVRLSQRPKPVLEPAQLNERDVEIQKLINRVREALVKFQALERRLSTEKARSDHLVRMLQKQKNFTFHRRRLTAYNSQQEFDNSPKARPGEGTRSNTPAEISDPFRAFCERLLLQNKIWAQQREIKSLRKNLESMKDANSSNAFQAFCDRLVLSNNIWKQQKEIDLLMTEAEQLKRSRVMAVTRAAKQMVLDVRKERLTEEFVKDLIVEAEECKQAVISLRSEHEREVQELAEEWRQECRRLTKEVERLELAREARLVEQDLSNDQESELIARLSAVERKAAALDEQLDQPPTSTDAPGPYQNEDTETLSGSDLEQMSSMSTSTCVGSSGDRSPNEKSSFHETSATKRVGEKENRAPLPPLKLPTRRESSISLSSATKSPIRKLDPGPYAGFSFNPLFFGNPSISKTDDTMEIDSPDRRLRTFSLKSPPPPEQRKAGSLTKNMRKRTEWRV